MTSDLEDLVRATLVAHAPSTVRPADWPTLRARAAQRTIAGRTTAVVGAAAVGSLAITTPWAVAPAGVAPAAPQQTLEPPSTPAPEQPAVALDPAVVDEALTHQRAVNGDWSTGPATQETIERALGTLMASSEVTDAAAQPQVIWSSAGHADDSAQGPQVLVAVEQADGWVLGFWDERRPFGPWIRSMSFDTMPGGSLEDRLVGLVIPDGAYTNIGGELVVYVPPVATTRVVSVVTQAQVDAGVLQPVGAEIDLDDGFGGYIVSTPWTVRAFAADGTILDEHTFR